MPNLVFLTRPGLQILGKTQTGVFSISGFLVSPWHETWTSNLTWQEKKITSKKIWRWRHFGNCEVIAIFSIYGKFGATRKLDSKRIVCKTYLFINGNLLSYKNRTKKSLTQLSHYCFDKGTILAGKADFLKKMQYKRYKKVYLLKLHMIVYLCAKFKVFSIILTSFRHGGGEGGGVILLLLHPTQNEYLKSPSGLGLKNIKSTAKFSPIFSTLI